MITVCDVTDYLTTEGAARLAAIRRRDPARAFEIFERIRRACDCREDQANVAIVAGVS